MLHSRLPAADRSPLATTARIDPVWPSQREWKCSSKKKSFSTPKHPSSQFNTIRNQTASRVKMVMKCTEADGEKRIKKKKAREKEIRKENH